VKYASVTVHAKSATDWYVVVTKKNGKVRRYGPLPPREAVYWFDRLKKRK